MATDTENADVKAMIQSLYQFANILPVWDGEVNEKVAEVFGIMLSETKKCSTAFGWVPKPPGGRASVTWLAMQFGNGIFNSHCSRLSFTCARGVIYKWKTQLNMASLGIAMSGMQKWA
jgi:hypothetical protein